MIDAKRLAEIEDVLARLQLRVGPTAAELECSAAIRDLLDERRELIAARKRLAQVLPDDSRAICLDAECKQTVGHLVGRLWNEPRDD